MLQNKSDDVHLLQDIGLGKTATLCYVQLVKLGAASVPQLAKRLALPRTGLYRVLQKLEERGFVVRLKTDTQPTYFQARPLDVALEHYFVFQRQTVLPLLDKSSKIKQKSGQMKILTGRDEIFDTYLRLAGQAQQTF